MSQCTPSFGFFLALIWSTWSTWSYGEGFDQNWEFAQTIPGVISPECPDPCCPDPAWNVNCGSHCCPTGSLCIDRKKGRCEPPEVVPDFSTENLQDALQQVLSAKSDDDGNIAITFATSSTLPLLCNLVASMKRTVPPMENFMVIAFDTKTFEYCQTNGISAVKAVWHTSVEKLPEASKKKLYWLYKELMVMKQVILATILDLGYNFLSLDTDIVFNRNFFTSIRNITQYDITAQPFHCKSPDKCYGVNGGFHYFRSNNATLEVVNNSIGRLWRGNNHQPSINAAVQDNNNLLVNSLTWFDVPTFDEYLYSCLGFAWQEHASNVVAVHASTHTTHITKHPYNCAPEIRQWISAESTIRGKVDFMVMSNLFDQSCLGLLLEA